MLSTREQYLLLNVIPGVGSTQLRRLLAAFEDDLARLWAASIETLQQVGGISPRLAQRLATGMRNDAALARELSLAARHQVRLVTLADAEYPERLRTIPDPPLALYIRGSLVEADQCAVAVVGARHASRYGLQAAEQLSEALAQRDVTIVSGLARGIDAAAHRGALQAAGRTIAVLGSGFAHLYPAEHAPLAAQIAEHGAVISEYPMETRPLAHHFPRRNRIISGLSLGVVVVEAAARSGALITADCALEQGREVFAVPGPITAVTSQGTHGLVQQGAKLVTSVDDVLEELGLNEAPAMARVSGASAEEIRLPESERRIFACLRREPRDLEAIAEESGLALPEVSCLLLQLELNRLVRQLPGKHFVRA